MIRDFADKKKKKKTSKKFFKAKGLIVITGCGISHFFPAMYLALDRKRRRFQNIQEPWQHKLGIIIFLIEYLLVYPILSQYLVVLQTWRRRLGLEWSLVISLVRSLENPRSSLETQRERERVISVTVVVLFLLFSHVLTSAGVKCSAFQGRLWVYVKRKSKEGTWRGYLVINSHSTDQL